MTWTDTNGKRRQGDEPLTRITLKQLAHDAALDKDTEEFRQWMDRLYRFDREWEK